MNTKETSKDSVLVVGSVALDDISTPSAKRQRSLGGSAVYFSWACSFFSPVSMVGVVGEDFPEKHESMLSNRGIDIRGLKRKKGKTFHWSGRYDNDFNVAHTLKTDLNVFSAFVPRIFSYQRKMKCLFLANIDPQLQLAVAKSMEGPRLIAADTMNYWIDTKKDDLFEVLKIIDFLLINDAEVRQLAGENNIIRACKKLISKGPRGILVKQGEYGAMMYYRDPLKKRFSVFSVPSFPVETVVDPTGAGDSFAGAFMGYMSASGKIDDKTLRAAVVNGCVAASFAVEGFSLDGIKNRTMTSINRRKKILKDISLID
ncbi:PfkB family carbohydrate kinase [Elusimicrobiota bacterium]